MTKSESPSLAQSMTLFPRYAWKGFGLLCFCLAVSSCRREAVPVTRQWTTMGTYASITVPAAAEKELPATVASAERVFAEYEQQLSAYIASSDISRLNAAAGSAEPVRVSAVTSQALSLSRHYGEISNGGFDVTIAPLMRLWGFRGGEPPAALPSVSDRQLVLPLVNYRMMELGDGMARLPQKGMRVDLGGIGKGYAVDACFDALSSTACRNSLVNLGGNMRGMGMAAPGRGWHVGVRHPFDHSKLIGTIDLPDGWAVATSGNYEQFVEVDGKRYAHIMDPRTGLPVQGMAGVTVLSQRAVEADALSTALFVAGMDDARDILIKAPDSEALLVPDRRPLEIHVTQGFANHFTALPEYQKAVRVLEG